MCDYLLFVVALFTTTVDPGIVTYDMTCDPVFSFYLKTVSTELDISDPQEAESMFRSPWNSCFYTSIKTMQDRYQEFKNAPCFGDSQRWKHIMTLDEVYAIKIYSYNHILWLDNIKPPFTSHRYDQWESHRKQTDILCRAWGKLYDIKYDTKRDRYYNYVIRREMNELKELIGDEAYWAGRMPPPVPVWNFTEIK